MNKTLFGVVAFDGHARYWFNNITNSRFLEFRDRGCPHKVCHHEPESEVAAWRPDGWTKDDEVLFYEWGKAERARKVVTT